MKRQTRKNLRKLADKNGLLYQEGRKTPTLQIYDDGTILRADTRLDLCKKMTVAEAYRTLKL